MAADAKPAATDLDAPLTARQRRLLPSEPYRIYLYIISLLGVCLIIAGLFQLPVGNVNFLLLLFAGCGRCRRNHVSAGADL